MTLSEDSKKKIKVALATYLDSCQQKKEIDENLKEVFKEVSDILEKKPAIVRKVFSNLKKKYDTGVDDLQELFEVFSAIE